MHYAVATMSNKIIQTQTCWVLLGPFVSINIEICNIAPCGSTCESFPETIIGMIGQLEHVLGIYEYADPYGLTGDKEHAVGLCSFQNQLRLCSDTKDTTVHFLMVEGAGSRDELPLPNRNCF